MIPLSQYFYDLPPEKIAYHPLDRRDQSKLLVARHRMITHSRFDRLTDFLPSNSILFFNDTKVIPARLFFQKDTGAEIEIFLLSPVHPTILVQQAMQLSSPVQWHCSIGNLKRWKENTVLYQEKENVRLEAKLIDREKGLVELVGTPPLPFAELISLFGATPLPPYIKRKADETDVERYQTVYSHFAGAVAAPTAGLHFTPEMLEIINKAGILTDFVTLHVSAGTFQPIKVPDASTHTMHSEQIILTRKNIESLLLPDKFIVAVGTTSLRSLESLYWFGVKLLTDPTKDVQFKIGQSEPYNRTGEVPPRESAIRAVAEWMAKNELESISGETSIYIVPGYSFKVCQGLITNFHQPGSTLLLLIAAFMGERWKDIYQQALDSDYRFLSYGDSSLLLPD